MEGGPTPEEEKPSTSKELQKQGKSEDRKDDENMGSECEEDQFSYSSGTISMPISQANLMSKALGRTSLMAHSNQRKYKRMIDRRYTGRIQKKYRRGMDRRAPNKRRRVPISRMPRERSFCSILSHSTKSGNAGGPPACRYCGHQCCLRRYATELKRWGEQSFCSKCRRDILEMAKYIQNLRRGQPLSLICCEEPTKTRVEEGIQVCSNNFETPPSPLLLDKQKAESVHLEPTEGDGFCEITPQMIKDTLEELTKWREGVEIDTIMMHLQKIYPVRHSELHKELEIKLHIAVAIGILDYNSETMKWQLKPSLERHRKLNKNHVSLFWKLYNDSLKPVTKKESQENVREIQSKLN